MNCIGLCLEFMNSITIAIPTFNNAETISEAIESCLNQEYPRKEILVIDDCSTDNTVEIVRKYPVRLVVNEANLGIGENLKKLMTESTTRYIIYLCGDDLFANPYVVSDVVSIFNLHTRIGVIGRYFYFFLDGKTGAIGTCRDRNILTNTCCPSGVAFRTDETIQATNKIFIEMPSIVSQYLRKGWEWTMLEYDTVAARFWPGGNTGTKKSYYTESPLKNWIELLGQPIRFNEGFIQLKNRAPHLLWSEIKLAVKSDIKILRDLQFWLYAGASLLLPSWFLRRATVWYRDKIARRKARIIERGS